MLNLLLRVASQPLAIMPGYEIAFLSLLEMVRNQAQQEQDTQTDTQTQEHASVFIGTHDGQSKFNLTSDGVALVPVHGTLIDRAPWLGNRYGYTSYEGLEEQYRRLAADDEVRAVVLDIDSGGGMVSGIWDNVAALDQLKSVKPVYAVAANMACSAAYAIGCTAHQFYATRSSMVGSVGVLRQHWNVKKLLKKNGVETKFIHSGAKKVEGNPFDKLPSDVEAQWQASCDKSWQEFISHVSTYRPVSEQNVRDTQAGVFDGLEAVQNGFVDGVATIPQLLNQLKGKNMSNPSVPVIPGQPAVAPNAATVPVVQPQPAAQPAATAQPAVTDPQPVAEDPIARFNAVAFSEAGKRHPDVAQTLLASAATTQECLAVLESLPEPAAPAAQSPASFGDALAAQMQTAGNSAGITGEIAPQPGQAVQGGNNVTSLIEAMKQKCQ